MALICNLMRTMHEQIHFIKSISSCERAKAFQQCCSINQSKFLFKWIIILVCFCNCILLTPLLVFKYSRSKQFLYFSLTLTSYILKKLCTCLPTVVSNINLACCYTNQLWSVMDFQFFSLIMEYGHNEQMTNCEWSTWFIFGLWPCWV